MGVINNVHRHLNLNSIKRQIHKPKTIILESKPIIPEPNLSKPIIPEPNLSKPIIPEPILTIPEPKPKPEPNFPKLPKKSI